MKYTYKDHTSQGIVYRSQQSYLDWESEWEYEDGKLTCVKFMEGKCDDVLKILADPLKDKSEVKNVAYMYHRCILAWNRHKVEIEKQIGIHKPKKTKEVKIDKVLYCEFGKIGTGVMKVGGKKVQNVYSNNPTKTLWTEEKQKLADEYNRNREVFEDLQSELLKKIFYDKEK